MSLGKTNGQATATKPSIVEPQETGRPIRQPSKTTVEQYLKTAVELGNAGFQRGTGGGDSHDDLANSRPHRQYDPTNFIVPGSDAQGHSERIQCRVPPGVLRQISAIVASKKFPFRTDGDVYRWAVWVGIQLLDRLEPTPNTFITRVEAANAIIREQVYLQEYQTTLVELERTVQMCLANSSVGGRGQAIKMIARVQHEYGKIEEEYWRERLLREVKERFGHLLGSTRPADLLEAEDVEPQT